MSSQHVTMRRPHDYWETGAEPDLRKMASARTAHRVWEKRQSLQEGFAAPTHNGKQFSRQWGKTFVALVVSAAATFSTGGTENVGPTPVIPLSAERPALDVLRQELQRVLEAQKRNAPQAVSRPSRSRKRKASRVILEGLQRRAQELAREIGQRLYEEFAAQIEREFGPIQALQSEEISLQAMGTRRQVFEVPVLVETRPLRQLTAPANAAKAYRLMSTPEPGLAIYDVLAEKVTPSKDLSYRRVYTGEDARALAMEIKLIVTMKGGEWALCQQGRRAANGIAVRGLDLTKGLQPNNNKTYDDSLYLVIEEPDGDTEVYEYRMTTESSSGSRGVGRLDAKQVTYVRGLHKGKDPAYRLKGNVAEGTRRGMTGTYKIVGANMHSAYSRRDINAETPLLPNVSLGCQVVATSKRAFEQSVVSLLDSKGIKEFPYVIVEGDELALLDRALLDRNKHSILVHGIPRTGGPQT